MQKSPPYLYDERAMAESTWVRLFFNHFYPARSHTISNAVPSGVCTSPTARNPAFS